MAAEVFLNDTTWTLAAAITSTTATSITVATVVGSLDVASTSAGAGTYSMRIRIDNEIMIVTGTSTLTWTVTRGAEGTTAATHLISAPISQVLTKGAIATIGGGGTGLSEGAFSALPTVGTSGRLYLPTDSPLAYFDNGTTWDAFGPIFPLTKPPASGSWTLVGSNANSAISYTNGCPKLTSSGAPSGTNNVTLIEMAPPTAPWTLTAAILPHAGAMNPGNRQVGICMRDSSSGKIVTHCLDFNGAVKLANYEWTNTTTYSGNNWNVNAAAAIDLSQVRFLRISCDVANGHTTYSSSDGVTFTLTQSSLGATITPDRVGFFINAGVSGLFIGGTLIHWTLTSP
jgi:hypothetical protein